MLTNIENKIGIISYDNSLCDQMIADGLNKYKGNFILLKKSYEMHEAGCCFAVSVYLKFGTSISEFSESFFNYIINFIENSLELPVESVTININGIYSKKLAKRNIKIEYSPKLGITDSRN